jgi:integrase
VGAEIAYAPRNRSVRSSGELRFRFFDKFSSRYRVVRPTYENEPDSALQNQHLSFVGRTKGSSKLDLRTVQQWLGHSDMESTMRYLKPSRSQQTRERVNEIFA